MPLGGASIYSAWRAQYLRRLVGPAFTPLARTQTEILHKMLSQLPAG